MEYSREVEDEVVRPNDVEVIPPNSQNAALLRMIQNPTELQRLFSLDPEQAKTVKALATSGGTFAAVRLLAEYIGTPLAGAAGGFLAGLISDKLLGKG